MGWYVVGGRWDGWINDRKASGEQIDANMATTEQAIERHKIPMPSSHRTANGTNTVKWAGGASCSQKTSNGIPTP